MYKFFCFMLVLATACGRHHFGLKDVIERIVEDAMEQDDNFSCQGKADGDYKHPTNCYKFIKCAQGMRHEFNCPSGLRWDDVAKNCLNVPCHTGGGNTVTTTTTEAPATSMCTENRGIGSNTKHAVGESWTESNCIGCPGYDIYCSRCTCVLKNGKAVNNCVQVCQQFSPCGSRPSTYTFEKASNSPANCYCQNYYCGNA